MKKNMFIIISIMTVILFSGCGSKVSLVKESSEIKGKEHTTYVVEGVESWRSPSGGYNISTRNAHMLLNAAKATVEEGKKFFAIYKPDAISNIGGSLVNTPEEYIEKCLPSSANITTAGNAMCGFDGKRAKAKMHIVMFKKQPFEYTTYDAQYVIDYLNENGFDREDSWDEFVDETR